MRAAASRVEREGLGLICLDQNQLRDQTLYGLDARLVKPEPSRNYGGRDAATAVMDHVTAVGFRPDDALVLTDLATFRVVGNPEVIWIEAS
jgi:hypothetical protein